MPLLHVSTDTITPLYAHSALSEPRLVPTPLPVFESYKGCVVAYFGAYQFARIHFMVQVSDVACRTIMYVPLMYPL